MGPVSLETLETWLRERVAAEAATWLARAFADARREGIESERFSIDWSGAGRRLGRNSLALTEPAKLADGGELSAGEWDADELGRGLLLLAAAQGREPAMVASRVDELFRLGEMREQQAILRVLSLLPEPVRYVTLAADAVRINVLPVIEALACDNPFPAAHMPELAFNQMVMKAIFNELSLARVVGLGARNNEELRRMVKGYASERRAAGRPVPADTALIVPDDGLQGV